MVEQLYVCVYRKDELLTISIARPSFNRQDAEAANTILTHNMIQGTEATCKYKKVSNLVTLTLSETSVNFAKV